MDGGSSDVKVGGGDPAALVEAGAWRGTGRGVRGLGGGEGEGLVDGVNVGKDVVEGVDADVEALRTTAGGRAGVVVVFFGVGRGDEGGRIADCGAACAGGGPLPQPDVLGVLVAPS